MVLVNGGKNLQKEKNKGWKWFRPLLFLLVIIFIVIVAVIALFPFHSRDLNFTLVHGNGSYTVSLARNVISSGKCKNIVLHGIDTHAVIKKIKIYGKDSTMRLWETDAVNFY